MCTRSEEFYSVPDHVPTTSSDDSRLTIQKATTIVPGLMNKPSKSPLPAPSPFKSGTNVAYGVLDAQKKTLTGFEVCTGDSSDEELSMYKV